ncbi:unnamed protein product [Kuraishia capsulata CBS 1993]|uniref:Fe2OG dioxygenase domain-containing protein n=1 Tax=Kuraishia capsulata CBS 1993 TaxID=1382522 RepID=W6MF74_9ASCO|nr:uncharacterized protein KUCA_T00000041001 [Kuraishia capsulata CBS 1993]CDK24081.1 unnamed protein product [Kuraishia capsulata CBS 1993]
MAKKTVNTKTEAPEPQAEFPKSLKQFKPAPYFQSTAESLAKDQIVTIDKLFSSKFCRELIGVFGSFDLVTAYIQKRNYYAPRYNDRIMLSDRQTADSLWVHLKSVLLEAQDPWIRNEFSNAIGLNPDFRIYRYKKGHYFEDHYDESVKVGTNFTKWTVLIYLTGDDEFKGGETKFENGVAVHPSKGMCLLHKHGDYCLMHRSELVTAGEKWVLRTDVVFQPRPK